MTDLHPIDLQEWKVIYGSQKMTADLSNEELVTRLRDLAFRVHEGIVFDDEVSGSDMWMSGHELETLNLAISALGGTPVKLMEQDETPGEGEDLTALFHEVPF